MKTTKTDRLPKSSAMDWTRSPISIAIWWVIPIVAGNVADQLPLPWPAPAIAWAAALAWIGLGCVLNARRCHRRHCYFSGPVLLAGAIVVAVHGWGLVPLGPNGLSLTLWTTPLGLWRFPSCLSWFGDGIRSDDRIQAALSDWARNDRPRQSCRVLQRARTS